MAAVPDSTAASLIPGRQRPWLRDCGLIAVLMVTFAAFAYAIIVAGGDPFSVVTPRPALPWVPFGIAAGAIYFRGADRWPGVFVGGLGVHLLLTHAPWISLLVQPLALTVGALLVRRLLRAWRFNPFLENWKDPLLLWAAAGISASVVMVLSMAGGYASARFTPGRVNPQLMQAILGAKGQPEFLSMLPTGLRWWANWTAGVALVVPVFHGLDSATWRAIRGRLGELLALTAALTAWAIVAFMPLPLFVLVLLGTVALVIVMWAAVRFGAALAMFAIVAFALIESAAFVLGRGPLAGRPEEAILFEWAFVSTIAILAMVLIALLAERDEATRRHTAAETRYRALFESTPRPLWVYEPTGLQVLIANEAAIRLYGYSREEFTTLRATDLEAGTARPGAASRHGFTPLGDGERLHRTASGEVIAVELHSEPIEVDGRTVRLVFGEDVTDRNRTRRAALDAADRTKRQLGRELHDGLGQELVALVMHVRSEIRRLQRGEAGDVAELEFMEAVSLRALASCRNVARGLSALAETDGDLCRALRDLPGMFPHDGAPVITVAVVNDHLLALPIAARDHVYRIAQEALTNAIKHAQAQRIRIHLEVAAEVVVLTIEDDGTGLSPASTLTSGVGLASIRHRASAISARLRVSGRPGGGTELRLECPQPAARLAASVGDP